MRFASCIAAHNALAERALRVRCLQGMNLACCFGICSAYLVFVASTLATVFPVVRVHRCCVSTHAC
jgi:hypothetical protein